MPFQKGHNLAKGRPKGAVSKRTKEQIERVEWALSVLDDSLEKDIKAMSETERVKLWAVLQEFVRPKLSRTTLVGDDKQPITVNFTPFGSQGK